MRPDDDPQPRKLSRRLRRMLRHAEKTGGLTFVSTDHVHLGRRLPATAAGIFASPSSGRPDKR